MGEVKLIPVYYMSIVTSLGCACCLHAVVGEGQACKELNPLQSSFDYPVPDIPAIPIQRHFFEMIRSEKKSASASA